MREGWEIRKVKEICDKASSNIAQKEIAGLSGNYPVYGASGYVQNVDFFHRDKPYIGIVKDGSGVGRVNTYPAKSSLLGTLQYIIPKDGYLLGYVAYLLKSLNLGKFATGAAIPHIYFKEYGECKVPVPPIAEQEKIVAELDCLTGIIEKKKQQLEELDKLAQSIFYEMFGDPIANEKGWKKMLLGEICAPKKSIARASKTYKANETIHYIDIASIDNSQALLTGTTSFVFAEAPSRAQQKVEKGDVLISLVRPNLRNIAIVEYDDSLLVASSGFCVLRAKDSNPRFIKAFALTDGFTRYLTDRTAGANYPAVREEDIRACSLGVPPINLQNEFAKKIEAVEKQKELVKRSIVETETLFNSRMDYWFN